jgi:hypothetical protein
MARSGPVTKAADTVPIGLAKVLVNADWISSFESRDKTLNDIEDTLGALDSSSFNSEVDFWRLESGFPIMEDKVVPLRERASFELEFKEVHPRNMALARGADPSGYNELHSGEIKLGNLSNPAYVRMEAVYTYPNQTNHMYFIFPRAQVTSSASISFAQEDNPNVPVTIEAKRADSEVQEVQESDAITEKDTWDDAPLGIIKFD